MLTTELRYFFTGPIGKKLKQLIQLEELQKESREDTYLKFRYADTCGLKLREGFLEIKTLVKNPEIEKLSLSQWEKTSFAVLEKKNLKGELIHIQKKRYIKFFGMHLETITEEEAEKSPYCQLEISRIEIGKKVFHSFCLEANDDNSALLLDLYRHLERKLGGLDFLKQGMRMGYPQFLKDISR